MNRLLKAIEIEETQYGLALNTSNCEYLRFGPAKSALFAEQTKVPLKSEVKYLGCSMNNKADPECTGKRIALHQPKTRLLCNSDKIVT